MSAAEPDRKIRVLIVDDSAAVRTTLSDIIASDPELEVMATAADPYIAVERIRHEVPDVIFLDIELPRMDGLTFLRKLMSQRPIPVVICSSHASEGSDTLIEALEAGAVDVVAKPRVDTAQFLSDSRERICAAARSAAHARLKGGGRPPAPKLNVEAKLTADAVIPPRSAARAASSAATMPTTEPIICIGASTGGTEALRDILVELPATTPGIIIVQHMPERFTAAFARRLDTLCQVRVKEAEDGDVVEPGRVLIAPGGHHMTLQRSGTRYTVQVVDGPHVSRHKPSVDVMFRSAAYGAGRNALGIILTGMGDDGAKGLLEMKQAGAATLAQDEESSVVFGMPKEAIALGAAQKVVSLRRVASEITTYAALRKGAA
ncbi:chemotaxis response regulator protein-glutamate methylesterase [Devosia sp. ZB163]|uniref:protein-glutamate methylesterase/protein-glutamine glutaminase n=1 Tax=Devosia sp. ZB163 TaxID=3025938 RepID=UPI002361CDDD|nr:chemotaxis response regulator protein-glutamate methylesterase [Devosia sp. ZB163]MDC9823105.1 chemotaxis response regulator protein-glutamate methylesterase [Devosia sp. ZB163]